MKEEVFERLFPTDKTTYNFFFDYNTFYLTIPCLGCEKPITKRFNRKVFRCGEKNCGKREISIRKGTIFFFLYKFEGEADTSKDESSGIGLKNVRSRLVLLYPERHNLVIHADRNLFIINLTVKLL